MSSIGTRPASMNDARRSLPTTSDFFTRTRSVGRSSFRATSLAVPSASDSSCACQTSAGELEIS